MAIKHLENSFVLRESIPLQSMDNVNVHVIDAVKISTHMQAFQSCTRTAILRIVSIFSRTLESVFALFSQFFFQVWLQFIHANAMYLVVYNLCPLLF